MDFAQIRTVMREATGPGGGGGPSNKPVIVLILGTYLLMKTIENVYSR